MTKTIELRKELTRIFRTVLVEVHNEVVPEEAIYPYLSYDLRELQEQYGRTTYTLEVNILDYGLSTTQVETLADTIQSILHKYYFIDGNIQFSCYKLARMTVQEEDKKIRRRRLTFEILLSEKRGE